MLDITRDACDLSVKRLKNISLPTKGTKILNYSNTYKQTMSIDIETYRLKAQEAIEYVFVKEYHNSLGIPMPIVKMLLPDDANYSTGQYYITIDKTWQIHLNFGKLPISYHEFQNKVKVLTRHEIEHYMCCPFDVITHFRMLKRIRDVYYKHFSHLGINIEYACGAISNQAADIIVDTKTIIDIVKKL